MVNERPDQQEALFDDLSDIPYFAHPSQETYVALTPEQRRRIDAVADAMTKDDVLRLTRLFEELPLD